MSVSKSDNKSILKETKANELKRLEMMNKVSRILISNFPLEELFTRIMDTVLDVTEAERSFLMLLDDTGNIYPRTFRGSSEYGNGLDELRDRIVHYTMRKGSPLYIRNAQEDLLKYKDLCEGINVDNIPIKTVICHPLRNAPKTSQTSELDSQHERRKGKDVNQPPISLLDNKALLYGRYGNNRSACKLYRYFYREKSFL
jgi:transcriptional regulator with GAF, ATPase, and Fis domain